MKRSRWGRFWDLFWNLFFPAKCVSCDEVLDYQSTEALCPHCRSKYETEKGFLCPECQKPHTECECETKKLTRYVKKELHLVEYLKEDSVVRDMILFAKDLHYEFLYRMLNDELSALLDAKVKDISDHVFTFVPRSGKNIAEYGVDQAREVAKRLAATFDADFAPVIRRKNRGEQKKLTAKEREDNTKGVYCLDSKKAGLIMGRSVILYDDVVTTGATLAACAKLLKEAGAKEIITLTFGKAYLDKSKGKIPILK